MIYKGISPAFAFKKDTPPPNHFAGGAIPYGSRDLTKNYHILFLRGIILQSSRYMRHNAQYTRPRELR